MNPFKQEYPSDPALEEQVHDLLAPIGTDTPDPDAASHTQRMVVEAAAQPAAPASLGFRQRMVLGAAALITPLMAVTAVGAAVGGGPVDSLASAMGMGDNEVSQTADETPTEDPTATDTPTDPTETPTATETPTDPTETPTEGTGDEGDEAVEGEEFDPHANGKGCDDKLWAENPDGPPFGGHDTPVGPCNEEEDEEATATPEATEEPTEEAVEDEDDESKGNGYGHGNSNGKGHEKAKGNGHKKHGEGGEEATAEPTASAESGGDATSSGPGKGNGKGKGKNK